MLKNSSTGYGWMTKSFHWVMAIVIIGIIIAGFIMTRMDPSDTKWFVYGQHKAFGVIILLLIPMRIIWRFLNTHPALPQTVPNWQKKAANANILLLYILVVVMPVSGFMMSYFGKHPINMFGLFTIPSSEEKIADISGTAHWIHMQVAWVIAASVLLHIGAAVHHHFILKDNTLSRMMPGKD